MRKKKNIKLAIRLLAMPSALCLAQLEVMGISAYMNEVRPHDDALNMAINGIEAVLLVATAWWFMQTKDEVI